MGLRTHTYGHPLLGAPLFRSVDPGGAWCPLRHFEIRRVPPAWKGEEPQNGSANTHVWPSSFGGASLQICRARWRLVSTSTFRNTPGTTGLEGGRTAKWVCEHTRMAILFWGRLSSDL